MIWGSCFKNGNTKFEKNVVFISKIRLFKYISGQITAEICKNKNLKNAFSKIRHKMSMGRSPTKIFSVSKFFYRNFVEKNFRGRGPQKSTFFGLFSKIDTRNFCQFGKNVFFVLPIFLKNRGNGGLFLGVRLNFFLQKLINIAGFVCKN